MKLLIISTLLIFSALLPESPDCDNLKIKTKITHTTTGESNGQIVVTVVKGQPPYKASLFAERKNDNLLEVGLEDLKNLPAGKYILVVQDAGDCATQEKVILK
jgi:hypothetical protein